MQTGRSFTMKRKLFSLCIALVMLFVTTVPAFATSTSDDIITDLEERTWINGNGETLVLPPIDVSENSYIPPIIPEGTDPEDLISLPTASPNSVIGTDTRTPVNNPMNYPNSPIAELKLEFGPLTTYYGTGFLVAPNLLLTAGHNIVHQVFGSCTKITVMFGGRNSNGWRFTITPAQIPIPQFIGMKTLTCDMILPSFVFPTMLETRLVHLLCRQWEILNYLC